VTATGRIIEAGDGLTAEAFTGRAAEVIADKERHIEKLAPLAEIGAKVRRGPGMRAADQDREDFKRIAGELRDAGLDRADAPAEPRLKPYFRKYPDRARVWLRDVYPKRGPGRPLTRK
jgi:hypothetical protein